MRWSAAVVLCLAVAMPAAPQRSAAAKSQAKKRPAAAPKPVAAAAVPAPAKFPLETLRIEGNRKFASEKIIMASGLKIGQPVAKEDFDAARERLLATGGFMSVGYKFEPGKSGTGFDAVLEVAETTPLFRYRFEELPAADADLRAALAKREPLFAEEIPAAREVIARYEKALAEFLEGKTPVEGRLRNELAGEPVVLFRPPGDRPRIAEIRFLGNSVIDTATLANTFSAVAIGATFTDPNVRLLLDSSIRRLYDAKGRLRMAFTKIEGEPSKRPGVNGVALAVTIDEGPEYTLGAVRFNGVARTQQAEVEKLANFQSKQMADFDQIDAGLLRITKRYKATGYLKVATKVDRAMHDTEKTVDLTVTITPGAQYVFGKLTVVGLDLLSEPAVHKLWGERAGKPFDPEFPDAFLKNIRDERMFDNLGETTAITKINEDTRTADVTVTFKGAPPEKDRQRF